MIENVGVRCSPLKIEKAVVGEVDDRGPVGTSLEADRQFARTRQAIADTNLEPSGIVFLAVGAGVSERHAGLRTIIDLGDLPEFSVKAIRPAMKRMLAVIGRQ